MLEFHPSYGDSEPIAVIGLSGRFPQAPDIEAFWRTLVEGRCVTRPFSDAELSAAGIVPSERGTPSFVAAGAVLDDAETFDAALFGYAPAEAELIDPQQRLFLQESWRALESAGYPPLAVPHLTGVFGSARMSTYPAAREASFRSLSKARGMMALIGNDKDYLCLRVAYKLNLHGPAMTVQTACSSSLVAVHVACESLRNGECDMALAGGVGVSFPQCAGYSHQPGMIFSPDATCRPFDAGANGTFAGHGVGVVVLRRLEDARRDGDSILAVLRGSAFNNDGNRKVGFTAPSGIGQRDVIRDAWAYADIDGDEIDLIEAHGTGTPLGDPIEVEALRAAFANREAGRKPVALGSLKGNFGHMDTAAGIAALIKTVLAVNRGVIPPSSGFERPNPALELERSPFQVPRTAQRWDRPLRTAGVSSFGIGGTNCHVVVQSYPAASAAAAGADDDSADGYLLLSAASETSLRGLAGAYAGAWASQSPAALARAALTGRQLDLDWRLAVPVLSESGEALAAYAKGGSDPLLLGGRRSGRGRTAWLFSGFGSQWAGMAGGVYRASSAFAREIDACAALCDADLDVPLKDLLFSQDSAWLSRADLAQPALVAFELALAAHWRAVGAEPDVVLGHSWGEYAAAVVAGLYQPEDVLRLALRSGALMARCKDGAILAVFSDHPDLRARAERAGLDLAADNGERHQVFSGGADAVAAFSRELEANGIRSRLVASGFAAHSRHLDPILAEFVSCCRRALPAAAEPRIPFISTVDALPVTADSFADGRYWARQMRSPTLYRQAREPLRALGVDVCLEIGPSSVLTDMGERDNPDQFRWIASCRRGVAGDEAMREAAARMFAAGHDLLWSDLFSADGPRGTAPTYVFDAHRFWWREPDAPPARDPVATATLPQAERAAREGLAEIDLGRLAGFSARVAALHAIYVDRAVETALGRTLDQPASAIAILRSGRFLPRYRQLLVRLLDACVEDGLYTCDGGDYRRVRRPDSERLDEILVTLRDDCEGIDAIPETIRRAGEALSAMLRGQIDPVAVIFPAGQSGGVERLYEDLSFGRYFNRLAAAVLSDLCAGRSAAAPFHILEVGGGTGGTTSSLLPILRGRSGVRYDFSDISAVFTRRAETKFAAFPFVRFCELDLERPALDQGFDAGRYDLIVAANVIHATRDIAATLAHLRPLLKPGGRLLMREITRPARLFDFVFGPLVAPIADLEARRGQLFLSVDGWEAQCRAAGFDRFDVLPAPSLATGDLCEHVLLASLPGAVPVGSAASAAGHAAPGGMPGWDLSECAGDADALSGRLDRLCRDLSSGIPGGAALRLRADTVTAPADLTLARVVRGTGLFGQSRLRFEGQVSGGGWVPLALAETTPSPVGGAAILPREAPDTVYRRDFRPLSLHPDAQAIGRDEMPEGVAEALESAGIASVSNRRLIWLGSRSALELAETARTALVRWPEDDLVFVTRQAWAVGSDEDIDLEAHAAWGFLRVTGNESRRRVIQAVDLALAAPWSDLVLALRALRPGVPFVLVRDGLCLSPGLSPPAVPAQPSILLPGTFDPTRWHVVTGGFGGLGRLAVRWLLQAGARRIALFAPRVPADAEAFLDEVGAGRGCEVRHVACDCADADHMRQCLRVLAADGGVEGVIHAAGRLDDCPAVRLDPSRLEAVFAVKAGAARVLYDELALGPTRYLVLYSSAAAALGPKGQGAHALSCAYLDALATLAARRGAGPRVLSIAWGAWAEIGRAADEGRLEQLAGEGMLSLRPDEGVWHLEQAMIDGTPYRVAMRLSDPVRVGQTEREDAVPVVPPGSPALSAVGAVSVELPGDGAEVVRWLAASLREQLRLDDTDAIEDGRNLMELGLDSLMFLDLSATIERTFGVTIEAGAAYDDLTLASLAALIQARRPAAVSPAAGENELRHDAAGRFDPFPLTPIQHAYWLGRTDLIGHGGVACHVVFEWDKDSLDLDPDRLEAAWNALVRRHDMLRSVISPDGRQRVLETVPDYRFARFDLRPCPPDERSARLAETRTRLERQVLPTESWPIFEIALSYTEGTRYRLHVNLDLLQFDTQSFKVMMDDWAALYRGASLPPLGCVFRDYVLAGQSRRESRDWKKAWCGWQSLLSGLPPAPVLPRRGGTVPHPPRFAALQHRVPAAEWNALKAFWRGRGLTPSVALLTLYAGVLAGWTRSPRFSLNVTYFNRRPCHPDIGALIGDFTSVLLLDYDDREGDALLERMEVVQQRFWHRLGLAEVDGVEVMREWGRLHHGGGRATMPFVFTSMLGMTFDGDSIEAALGSFLGDPVSAFTQTPQVWLDHQVMESADGLTLNWFFMEDVFPDGLPAAMFAVYADLIDAIAANPAGQERRSAAVAPVPAAVWQNDLGADAATVLCVERALQRFPGVRDLHIHPGPAEWRIDLVPDDPAPEVSPSVLALLSLAPPSEADERDADRAWHYLESRALTGLWRTVEATGRFAPGLVSDVDDIVAALGAAPKFRKLARQWLGQLVRAGMLERDGGGYRLGAGAAAVPVPPPPVAPWMDTLAGYLDRCIEAHAALFRGDVSPLDLLFGDGGDTARGLYQDHPTMRQLNQRAATLVSALADAEGMVRVLEVGAGTGATTRPLLSALDGRLLRYVFTDVSPLFLQDARRAFSENRGVEFARFDVNVPLDPVWTTGEGFDLIVAANVLHDSAHVVRTLRRLRLLLRPGGHLLLIEATTRDSAMQLASVGFLEGLSAYQDERLLDDAPMLSPPMWRTMLAESGFSLDRQWPESDDTPLRQHLFLARSPERPRLDPVRLHQVAADAAGRPLPPFRIRWCETLPLPLPLPLPLQDAAAEEGVAADGGVPPGQREIPADVAALWEEILARPVGAATEFFASGGDSLMATRLVSRLHRLGYTGASLRMLFRHPTLGGFCAGLPGRTQSSDGVGILLRDGAATPSTFVLHASDGDVGAYRLLADRLDNRVTGLCAPDLDGVTGFDDLVRRHGETVLAQSRHGEPIELIGWSYGAALAAAVARHLCGLGHRPTLILLDPVHRIDFTVLDTAAFCRRLAEPVTGLILPPGFDALPEAEMLDRFAGLAREAGLGPVSGGTGAVRAWLGQVRHLLDLMRTASLPTLTGISGLWITAARRPADWSDPADDWPALAVLPRHRVAAGHWDMMTSERGAAELAAALADWRKHGVIDGGQG